MTLLFLYLACTPIIQTMNKKVIKGIWLLGTATIITATIIFGGVLVNINDELDGYQREIDSINMQLSESQFHILQIEHNLLTYRMCALTGELGKNIPAFPKQELQKIYGYSLEVLRNYPLILSKPALKGYNPDSLFNACIDTSKEFSDEVIEKFTKVKNLNSQYRTLDTKRKTVQKWGIRLQLLGLILISFAEFWKRD